jgi:hypothetical protein
MPIETVETNAWRHLDVARDAIDMERTRRIQAMAPGESISFIDTPPPPPASLRQAQSSGTSANEGQTQSQTDTQTAAGPQTESAQQGAEALQAHMHALHVLNLTPFGGLGGGTAALFAHASATAAAAEAAAAVAAAASNAVTAPPAPTASRDQIALYELLLADPLLKEVVTQYCPDAPTSLPSNATTDALVAQYGHDLTCRLLQASTAIVRVFDDYREAMDRVAAAGPNAGGSGWVFTAGTAGSGDTDGTPDKWDFHPEIFTADYAKGDSLASRAFASSHGTDGSFAQITRTLCGISDAGEMYTLGSGGIDPLSAQFIRHDVGDGGSEVRWESARMGRNALVQIDLNEPLEMFDPKAVWFDQTLGFVTANENIVPEDSTIENIVIAVVVGVVTWGIGTVICQGVNVAVATAAGGAIMGATGAVIGGLFQNGTVHFEDVVRGAVVGAIMGAVSEKLDVKGIDPKTGAVTDWGARLGAVGGKATIQGMLAKLTGGEFKDAFGPGLASGLAAEVGRSINVEINKAIDAKTITAEQASAYRTFGRVVTTAISALADPDGDPVLASFAADFLGDMIKAEIPLPTVRDTVHADPSHTAAADGGFELNFDGLIDQAAASASSEASITTTGIDSTETQDASSQAGITGREQQGIDQSDDILFNRGDELAATNGNDPQILPDGRIQYPDGRIRTPSVEVITHPAQHDGSDGSLNAAATGSASQGETAGSRIPTNIDQSGRTSVYGSECVPVSGYVGAQPVGGYENLTPASDLPFLSSELTPNFLDGRTGTGIPYRDQAGQVFYRTFDANGTEKGLVAVAEGPSPLPLANLASAAAPAISIALTTESRSGALPLVIVAGATLAGAGLVIALRNGDTISREALDPERVRDDQLPPVNVPVSPGPAGTPGHVADNRDTSTPASIIPDSPGTSTTTLPMTEPSWADQLVHQNPSYGSNQQPGVLSGRRTAIGPREDEDTVRALTRENESADRLVQHGFNVEQNPTVEGPKNPDYKVNGESFDNIAPKTDNAFNIWQRTAQKVNTGQAANVVINLADSNASATSIIQEFSNNPVSDLKTVIFIDKSGDITVFKHNGGN